MSVFQNKKIRETYMGLVDFIVFLIEIEPTTTYAIICNKYEEVNDDSRSRRTS